MFTAERRHAGHTKRVTITRSQNGWDVKEEHDREVVREVNYTDWHRVERAIQVFELQRADDVLVRDE
jgi:hypothetical protein